MKPALPLVLFALPASSFGAVLTNSLSSFGNQAYTGSLGLDFNVGTAPVWVTELGAFDSGLNGFAAGTTVTVGIFDRASGALVGSSLAFTNAAPGILDGAWRTKPLAMPFRLAANGQYSVVAIGFNANDPNYNTDGNGSAAMNSALDRLAFVGARYGTGFALPANADGAPPIRYGAGNFSFDSVPEPSAFVAFALAGAALRRKRR